LLMLPLHSEKYSDCPGMDLIFGTLTSTSVHSRFSMIWVYTQGLGVYRVAILTHCKWFTVFLATLTVMSVPVSFIPPLFLNLYGVQSNCYLAMVRSFSADVID